MGYSPVAAEIDLTHRNSARISAAYCRVNRCIRCKYARMRLRSSLELEEISQFPERLNLQQRLSLRRGVDLRMFQHPRVFVKDEYSMKTRG